MNTGTMGDFSDIIEATFTPEHDGEKGESNVCPECGTSLNLHVPTGFAGEVGLKRLRCVTHLSARIRALEHGEEISRHNAAVIHKSREETNRIHEAQLARIARFVWPLVFGGTVPPPDTFGNGPVILAPDGRDDCAICGHLIGTLSAPHPASRTGEMSVTPGWQYGADGTTPYGVCGCTDAITPVSVSESRW